MGLIDSLFQDKGRATLLDLIMHNADVIERSEGRTRKDAEYLAICLVLDDLAQRENGQEGHKKVMEILKSEFSEHQSDVMVYLAYTRMDLPLKPEAETAFQARHKGSGQESPDGVAAPSAPDKERNFDDFHRLWSGATASPIYNKEAWLEIERQLLAAKLLGGA
ncbi:hypothetical protein ASD78_17805 [Lysobacter sp. Root667]|uniref:hypothetical protein n=1 Tax=Lysobacter sp. Root667 TaxID=1736581 RepID=UPI0006F6C5D4|nr:hypothetical protein [Lysobacter sp. Root667]KRA70690.1 hypothetical protein ASD78_17805 [Lysobacter sp. Root667]